MLNQKKIGGILIETKKKNNMIYLVIGIGLNVNQEEIPKKLQDIASSLIIENSNPLQREPLLAFILNEFEKIYKSAPDTWITEWKKYCTHMNQPITFHNNNELIKGVFIDIDNNGSAILDINSIKKTISSGILQLS